MLPRKNRLNVRRYFSDIRGKGKKISGSNFAIYFRINPEGIQPEFSTVISKKVSKSAVSRNRIRRLLHTALSKVISNTDPHLQGLIFVYKDFSTYKSDIVTQEIERLLTQSGLLKK